MIVWKVGQQVKMLGTFGRRSAVPHLKVELEEVGWSSWLAPYQAICPLLAWIIRHEHMQATTWGPSGAVQPFHQGCHASHGQCLSGAVGGHNSLCHTLGAGVSEKA